MNADSNKEFAASPRQVELGSCGKNASERVLPAAAAATHQLVLRESVLTSVSCAMTVTRLAMHPREHARTLDVADDRVNEDDALRPRFVPLRVHRGGVHGIVQELLVEQDAVGQLHCGSTQIRLFGPENGDQSAPLFIVFHQSSVFVAFREKNICQDKCCQEIIMVSSPEFRCVLPELGYDYRKQLKKKNRLVIMLAPMVMWASAPCIRWKEQLNIIAAQAGLSCQKSMCGAMVGMVALVCVSLESAGPETSCQSHRDTSWNILECLFIAHSNLVALPCDLLQPLETSFAFLGLLPCFI